ncbi:MAG: sigma-70 family RNA polymerase sigma factor [Clostridia bacterium]|nr:sigma-70 family RNA polymerase sigma factor [Clostridia bacterium]
MSSKITHDLVKNAQKGDVNSFGELYAIYNRDMFRFAYYYTGSVSAAEDCVSETALIAFQKINQLKKASCFKSWLFKILYNQCKAAQKEKAFAMNTVDYQSQVSLSSANDDKSESIELKNALKSLSDEEREILILYYSCGYTSKEISEITELKDATVRSKISRSTAKLRTLLSM